MRKDIAREIILTHATDIKGIGVARDFLTIDIDLRYLRCVYGCHHHLGRQLVAGEQFRGTGYDKRFEFVDPDVLESDISHKRMEHFALGITYIALQFGQQRDGRRTGHVLKHILFPVLAERILAFGNLRRKIVGDDFLLRLIRNEGKDLVPIGIDGLIQLVSLSRTGCQHHMTGSLEIVLILYVSRISVLAIGLTRNQEFEILRVIVKRIAHILNRCGFFEPLADLCGILFHLRFEVIVDGLVLLAGAGRSPAQALLHDGEAVEHLR